MNEILVIVKKDIKETVRTKAFLISIGAAIFVLYFFIATARDNITAMLEPGTMAIEPAVYIQSIVGGTIFTAALVVAVYFSFIISSYTLLIEKTKRSLESLLCTPLSLRQLWFGKIVAMFAPSFILGLLFMLAALCAINVFVVSPEVGQWVYPGAAPLVATIIGVPLIALFLSAIFSLLQLIAANVRLVNVVFMVILIGTMNGLMFGLRISTSAWMVVYISLGVVVVLAVIVFFLSKLLTKEKIILSSKG